MSALPKEPALPERPALPKEPSLKTKAPKVKVIAQAPWVFYLVENRGCTYAGVSPEPVTRLRKHNGELAGGAKYTLSKGPGWQHFCLVHGFQDKIQALQFEWAAKHVPPRDAGGVMNRVKKLYILLNKTHWTSKSPLASTVPLRVEWKQAGLMQPQAALPAYVTQTE